MSIEFLLTALIVVLTPGTGVLYTLTAAVAGGLRRSVIAAIGCTLGIVPHIVAAITGLAALLHASAAAFQFVKFAGVAYLLYLAWTTWRDRGSLKVDEDAAPGSALRTATGGVLINILNPKLTIFFLAFLPQFVVADAAGPTIQLLGMSGVFMLMTLVVFVGYGACASLVRDKVLSRPKVTAWFRRTVAGAFVGLSLRLAFAER